MSRQGSGREDRDRTTASGQDHGEVGALAGEGGQEERTNMKTRYIIMKSFGLKKNRVMTTLLTARRI